MPSASTASLDLGYYENGPWGGIEYHLDALSSGQVVASDSFVISDLGGRDNPAVAVLSVSGATFDQLHLYATFADKYSMPRAIIDDLTIPLMVPRPSASPPGVGSSRCIASRRQVFHPDSSRATGYRQKMTSAFWTFTESGPRKSPFGS
jgi:hypothetical protein